MHPKTAEFLTELGKIKWFSSVGEKIESPMLENTVFISTWDEALEYSTSEAYQDVLIETGNELTIFLHGNHMEKYRLWNIKVEEIKPRTERLVKEKIKEAEKENRIPKNFPNASLRWDILHICMSLEYSDYILTEYYKKLIYCYLNGHFPCGWVGDVPEDFEGAFNVGKLVVF